MGEYDELTSLRLLLRPFSRSGFGHLRAAKVVKIIDTKAGATKVLLKQLINTKIADMKQNEVFIEVMFLLVLQIQIQSPPSF